MTIIAVTDEEGRYEFPALIPGMTYHINIFRDGNGGTEENSP